MIGLFYTIHPLSKCDILHSLTTLDFLWQQHIQTLKFVEPTRGKCDSITVDVDKGCVWVNILIKRLFDKLFFINKLKKSYFHKLL